ncbi:MAG: Ig-like domain-containing protein [Bacillota bacterium]|nr:Ig-like domain-containing protein [Bacillota bacterium]
MKSIIVKVGLLTCFVFLGCSFKEAFADMTMSWPSKCSSYGEVIPNQNPSPQHMNCLLTNAALEAKIPPEVVKAVASKESGWRQFDQNGQPVVTQDSGIGIMQITNQSNYDQQRLKEDIYYNIQAGVETLVSMYNRIDLPKIKDVGSDVIENWYFPVMAYNGTKPVNSPLFQTDGSKNTNAYQEKVFALLEQDSFLQDTKLGLYPFNTVDFEYQTGSNENIVFKKMEYTLTDQMHASNYFFQTGDKVSVTTDGVKLRSQPSSTSSILKILGKNTGLIIDGDFKYDQTLGSINQFVWYPVKTEDQKLAGYISSAYITKKLDLPSVNPLDDNDLFLTGKAPANVKIQIMKGTTLIGSTVADANGFFKAGIPIQKAGTQLSVAYKDNLNALSPSSTITAADKTAPLAPIVNTVTNKSTIISGKTEVNAMVTVAIAGKTYTAKADRYGNYKIGIQVQNTGTTISIIAKDGAGNVSQVRKTTIVREAPNVPTVNAVNTKTTAVTGKTEKNANVVITIGKKIYTAKANANGDYKVLIPKQRAGTKIYVIAKDARGKVSAIRTVSVLK